MLCCRVCNEYGGSRSLVLPPPPPCTRACVHTCTCLCMCVHVRICVCALACVRACVHVRACMCVRACVRACACVRAYMVEVIERVLPGMVPRLERLCRRCAKKKHPGQPRRLGTFFARPNGAAPQKSHCIIQARVWSRRILVLKMHKSLQTCLHTHDTHATHVYRHVYL